MKPDPHPQVSWLGPRDRRHDKADLWTSFNTLVAGPPGSGKLSFLRAMTLSLDPGATCVVYDLESDPETQRATTAQLLTDLRARSVRGETRGAVHMIRHLHRLPPSTLTRFLASLEECLRASSAPPDAAERTDVRRVHATHHEDAIWPEATEESLARIFPCRIRLTQACGVQRDLSRFVRQVVAELNRRYGREVVEIESGVIDALRSRASTASLYELRNIIERAYFREFGKRLTREALEGQP